MKLCATDFGARTLGRLCFFESEVRAYEGDLFGTTGLQTPRSYHARFDRVSGESVLFLEDMAPLGTRPQLEGYTLVESRRPCLPRYPSSTQPSFLSLSTIHTYRRPPHCFLVHHRCVTPRHRRPGARGAVGAPGAVGLAVLCVR